MRCDNGKQISKFLKNTFVCLVQVQQRLIIPRHSRMSKEDADCDEGQLTVLQARPTVNITTKFPFSHCQHCAFIFIPFRRLVCSKVYIIPSYIVFKRCWKINKLVTKREKAWHSLIYRYNAYQPFKRVLIIVEYPSPLFQLELDYLFLIYRT